MAMERAFKKEIESLEAVFAFVDEFRRQELIPDEPLYAVKLALEELFTNMVKYHPESRREVVVRLERVADELVGTLTDSEVEPFDVTLVPAPAEPPLEKRRPAAWALAPGAADGGRPALRPHRRQQHGDFRLQLR